MRRIREVLRLKFLCKLSHREIARALGVSVGAVSHYGQLAEQAGLGWPEVEAIDEAQLEARLMPRAAPVGRRVLPDFAAIHQVCSANTRSSTCLHQEVLVMEAAQHRSGTHSDGCLQVMAGSRGGW